MDTLNLLFLPATNVMPSSSTVPIELDSEEDAPLSQRVAQGERQEQQTSQKGVGLARTVGGSLANASALEAAHQADAAVENERVAEINEAKATQNSSDAADTRRLMKGMPVDLEDTTLSSASAQATKERPAVSEERHGVIQFHTVSNSSNPLPQHLVILVGLKNIFQKQLPKMPREYIARLVFDRNHFGMAIVKRGYHVVGGVTYRPFQQKGFAEIVFFAITGTEQVRGYGNYLMNHLKDYVRKTWPGIEYFLTYADNYAVGYFKKQGFTKEITLDRSLWAAYIKDYEGGTLMQCSMLPHITYLEARDVLSKQKEAILTKLRLVSHSHIVHSGKDLWKAGVQKLDPATVPGLREVGWNPAMDELIRKPQRGPQHMTMQRILTDLQNHASAWPFLRPVNKDEVADYYEVIKYPMDLETMEVKLDGNVYTVLDQFLADAQHIFNNCRRYNAEGSNYVKNANKLEKYMRDRVQVYAPT